MTSMCCVRVVMVVGAVAVIVCMAMTAAVTMGMCVGLCMMVAVAIVGHMPAISAAFWLKR